jgi:hypothetical protein
MTARAHDPETCGLGPEFCPGCGDAAILDAVAKDEARGRWQAKRDASNFALMLRVARMVRRWHREAISRELRAVVADLKQRRPK